MANLKNKILQKLRSGKDLEEVFDSLSAGQENLLKNHSNPVFSNKDRNKILKKYTDLQNIGKSLYRYKALKENEYEKEAEEEKSNIENVVLKGGISYNKYVWHSENGENTCDECSALDGKEFEFYDEVPERPHPNCRCTVVVIEDSDIAIEDDENSEDGSEEGGNEPPSQNPNPQPSQKSPQPTPPPKNPPQAQPQKWIKPCDGPIVGKYGEQRSTHVHNGIDIAVPIGTPIKAVADGTVYYAGANDPRGYGQYVIITHNINGKIVTSEYGHLSSWNVQPGQQIKQGQIIAKSGNTGHSHGPHLHLTIREGVYKGTAVNPSKYVIY